MRSSANVKDWLSNDWKLVTRGSTYGKVNNSVENRRYENFKPKVWQILHRLQWTILLCPENPRWSEIPTQQAQTDGCKKNEIQGNEKQWEKFVVTTLPLPASLELEKGNHKSASRKRLKRREVEWAKEDETGITTKTPQTDTHTYPKKRDNSKRYCKESEEREVTDVRRRSTKDTQQPQHQTRTTITTTTSRTPCNSSRYLFPPLYTDFQRWSTRESHWWSGNSHRTNRKSLPNNFYTKEVCDHIQIVSTPN